MTRIIKQPRNISESFIFVRENILKSDLIYLLRWDQRCYVYVFMFFSTGQVIWNTWAVPDDRQTNTQLPEVCVRPTKVGNAIMTGIGSRQNPHTP